MQFFKKQAQLYVTNKAEKQEHTQLSDLDSSSLSDQNDFQSLKASASAYRLSRNESSSK